MKVIWHLISIKTLLFQACLPTCQNGVENCDIDKAYLSESKRTRLMNFHQLFDTYRVEFIEMHVYRIKTFLVCSLNNEAKYRQLAFIEIILI